MNRNLKNNKWKLILSVLTSFFLILGFISCGGGGGGGGDDSGDQATLGLLDEFTIESESVGETYSISVGLPLDYDESGSQYKSIFLLDGDWFFDKLYSKPEEYGDFIIIGINNSDRREIDYIEAGTCEDAGGGHEAFLDFIVSELVPHLDNYYNIDPAQRLLYGWSHGGTFVFYTLFEDHGETFPQLMSLDASLRCLRVTALEEAYHSANDSLPVTFYSSGATGGNATEVSPIMSMILQRNYTDFIGKYDQFSGTHEDAAQTAFPIGIDWLDSQ